MYVVVGSATGAERLRRVLERKVGFPARVVRTPDAIRSGGCSYSVLVNDKAQDIVKKMARGSGISCKGIYIEKKEKGERVYYAVS